MSLFEAPRHRTPRREVASGLSEDWPQLQGCAVTDVILDNSRPCDIASARGFCVKGERSALSPPALLRRADAPMSADNTSSCRALASLGSSAR